MSSTHQQTAELLTQLQTPCRHFQITPRLKKIPLGYCHRRGSEVSFGGRLCCARCRMFDCGLFDPLEKRKLRPINQADSSVIYNLELQAIRTGQKPNYFTWQLWLVFARVAEIWWMTQEEPPETSRSLSAADQLLSQSASEVKWRRYGLPEAKPDTTIFEYLCRFLPLETRWMKVQAKIKASDAIGAYIRRSSFSGKVSPRRIIIRYYEHRDIESMPGD